MKTTLLDAPVDPRIPCTCVVCGEGAEVWLGYTHDATPVVAGVFAVWKETEQRVPYCPEHARAFVTRFKRMRWLQSGLAASGALLLLAGALCFSEHGMFQGMRGLLGMAPAVGTGLSLVMTGLGFLGLAGLGFLAKPFLYDAFIVERDGRIHARARSKKFIRELSGTDVQSGS